VEATLPAGVRVSKAGGVFTHSIAMANSQSLPFFGENFFVATASNLSKLRWVLLVAGTVELRLPFSLSNYAKFKSPERNFVIPMTHYASLWTS